jgi:hypothetical protein
MIKLKNILLEKDEKPASENPDKMLVKNKESGKSYYISKDSFDPSVHEKSEPKEKKKEETSEEPTKKTDEKSAEGSGDKKKESDGTPDLMAGLGGGEKKDDKKDKEKDEKKKESPQQKLEKKLGSYVYLDDKEKEEIVQDIQNTRPDLKRKLINFRFTPFFREYDNLLQTLKTQDSVGDKEGSKQTVIQIRKTAKRFQSIAIAKLAALSTYKSDEQTIQAAKYYHNDSFSINSFLREGNKISWSKDELEKVIKSTPDAKTSMPTKYKMYNILLMDEHFKSPGAVLQNDTVVYRGIKKEILQRFIEAGEWIDNGFVSTTLNPLIAEDFSDRNLQTRGKTAIFEIKLTRGSRVLMLPCEEDEFCIESEITLPRGCRFRIEKHDKKKNIYTVSVEQPNA